jgi:hypothetical protein
MGVKPLYLTLVRTPVKRVGTKIVLLVNSFVLILKSETGLERL